MIQDENHQLATKLKLCSIRGCSQTNASNFASANRTAIAGPSGSSSCVITKQPTSKWSMPMLNANAVETTHYTVLLKSRPIHQWAMAKYWRASFPKESTIYSQIKETLVLHARLNWTEPNYSQSQNIKHKLTKQITDQTTLGSQTKSVHKKNASHLKSSK